MGLRQVVEVIKIVNEILGDPFGDVPAFTTIGYWIQELGLSVYKESSNSLKGKRYALIVDESMMIGSEKLLLIIAVPADSDRHAISDKDMIIVDISVARSWNSVTIGKALKKAAQKIGHNPEYVISDNDSKICKAIRESGYCHHRDISHTLGMFLERIYKKDADYRSLSQKVQNARLKYNMQNIAYLQPPSQRSIARFINMSQWVYWANSMLSGYETLPDNAREIYSFIPENASLIKELSEVMRCLNGIEKELKHNGVSKESVERCKSIVTNGIMLGNSRQRSLALRIIEYLDMEVGLVKNNESHHASSDGIERTFGIFKARKSSDNLAGVTPMVLMLPLRLALAATENCLQFDYKQRLEHERLKHIKQWAQEHLTENLTIKRRITLRRKGA